MQEMQTAKECTWNFFVLQNKIAFLVWPLFGWRTPNTNIVITMQGTEMLFEVRE
jgi:hypothetical protein